MPSITITCPTCLPIDCVPANDLLLYDLSTAAPRAPLSASAPVINCRNPDDLFQYSLQSGRRFSNIQYIFVLDCPEGYSCAGGYYPRTIVIDPVIVTVPDEVIGPGDVLNSDWFDSLTCCDSTISMFAAAGTAMSEVEQIINSSVAACALKKAQCEIFNSPANGVPAPVKNTANLTMTDPAKACLSTAYNSRIQSGKTTGRVFWHVVGGGLPPGLLLEDQTGFTVTQTASVGILGTPTAAGNFPFTMLMSDSLGKTLNKTLTISVLGITNSPTTASIGVPYSFQFTADGGTGPYTYSVLAAALPEGLAMNDTGLITGTPVNDTPCTFNVIVTDSVGQACASQFQMTPGSPCIALPDANSGFSYHQDLYFGDPALEPWSVAIIAGAIPGGAAGWQLDVINIPGLFAEVFIQCGTNPSTTGDFHFTVRITDKNGAFFDTCYTLKVNP